MQKANNAIVRVVRKGEIVEIPSRDIHVGDVLYLKEDDEIPCDCVVQKGAETDPRSDVETENPPQDASNTTKLLSQT